MNCRASIFPSQETAPVSPSFASGACFLLLLGWTQDSSGYSLKRRGICAVKKHLEATLVRADGVVRPAKSLGLNAFAELTTPSAAIRSLRDIRFMPHPPLLFKEGNMLARQFIHTFYDHAFFLESMKYARS